MVYPGKFKRYRTTRRYKSRAQARRVPRPIKSYIAKAISKSKETHKKESSLTETQLNSAATTPNYMSQVQYLAQGDTYYSRSAHMIKPVGVNLKFILHNNDTLGMFVRFVVLLNISGSKDTDYTTGTSLFEDDTGNIDFASANDRQRLTARINKEKYKVLRDTVIKLGGDNTADKMVYRKHWIPLRGTLMYDGSSAANPVRNQLIPLWWICEANEDPTTGKVVELSCTSQFYFKDL